MYGTSNVGKIRKDNQDSYMFDTFDNNCGYAVVCDGMGGASGGKTASLTAVNIFASNLDNISDKCSGNNVREALNNAIEKANFDIYSKAMKDDSLHGMGTTLVSVVIIDNSAYFANIGDSRAYLMRDSKLKRITRDHSAVQELVDQGLLTEHQARNHPNKNIITRALGVDKQIKFDFFEEHLEKDDIIVMCTDGVTNYIDDLEIPFEILKQQNLETVPQKLVELANKRGGSDNSTVVIIKI